MWSALTLIEATTLLLIASLADAISTAIIGGVFLTISNLTAIWLSHKLTERRRHEGTRQDRRRAPGRHRDRRRRRDDPDDHDPR